MEKYIPYGKLSKKEKRKLDSAKRGTWGADQSRHPEAAKQQSLQPKQNPELEA